MNSGWPADPAALARGACFLHALSPARDEHPIAVVCDSDADGLCAAVLTRRALERLGLANELLVARRGEHVHVDTLRQRIAALEPRALIVLDMGSREGSIVPRLPTLVLDHHQPAGLPEGALVISAFGHAPVAPTSLLVFHLLRSIVALEDSEWLAVLGAFADMGDRAMPGFDASVRRYGRTALGRASALVNAARRAKCPQPELALSVLTRAAGPSDIAQLRVEGTEQLAALRREVAEETTRCARTQPRFAGEYALLRFSSAAQVHPLIATRWAHRLRDSIVIAANEGYLPGRVNFAVRSARDIDLVARLRGLELDLGPEFAHGHAGATGGSVTRADFERLLAALGFAAMDGTPRVATRKGCSATSAMSRSASRLTRR